MAINGGGNGNGDTRRITHWIYGLISGVLLASIIALGKVAIENEHRLSVLEANYAHLNYQLDRIEVKVDALLERK